MAEVPYRGVPTVSPIGASGDDYQHVSTSPDAFGASIGRAKENIAEAVGKGAQVLGDASDTAVNFALKQQGMLNETAATDAETDAISQYSTIVDGVKSKEGLAAVAAQPDAEQAIRQVRQNILAKLPNAQAQRAFNTLALRHEAYALQDVGSYSSGQVKVADNKSATASLNQSVSQAGTYATASNDDRFNNVLQTSDFQIARILNNQGYGTDGGTGMAQDPTTGEITFNDSPKGKQGKAVYQDMQDKAKSQAWESRIHTLADDPQYGNVNAAVKVFNDNRDNIPAEAQARLSAYLAPKARAAQVNGSADTIIASVDGQYKSSLKPGAPSSQSTVPPTFNGEPWTEDTAQSTITRLLPGAVPTSLQRTPEHNAEVGGVPNSAHIAGQAMDFLPPKGMTPDGAIAAMKASGIPASQLFWDKDHIHWSWRGADNLTQPADNGQAQSSTPYVNRAEYYRSNYADILGRTDQQAQQEHPDDPGYVQAVHQRVEGRINDVIRQQDEMNRADSLKVFQAADGTLSNGNKPTSVDELVAINPAIRSSYESMLVNNPKAADGLDHILLANSKGPANGYGTDFYSFYQDAIAGNGDVTKYSHYVNNSPNGSLTTAGFAALKQTVQKANTPEGKAQLEAEQRFFATAHSQITFANPKMFLKDPKGEALFTKFMQASLPSIQAGVQSGKPMSDLFDPKSPDYVGKNIGAFMRNQTTQVNDMINAETLVTGAQANAGTADTSTPEALKASVASGKLPRADGEAIALKKGWIRSKPTGPSVPLPEGWQH